MQDAWMDGSQAGVKIARRNSNHLRFADATTLITESQDELKNLLMQLKEESDKAGLKLNIQELRSRQSVPSLHGKQMGKKVGTDGFSFLGLQNQMVTELMKLKDSCFLEGKL